jgi:hypothetical protein
MPQADDKLRAKMKVMFGSEIDEQGPIKFLTDAGFTLGKDWTWSKPGVTELWELAPDEFACIQFLVDEWDFGGLAERPTHADSEVTR